MAFFVRDEASPTYRTHLQSSNTPRALFKSSPIPELLARACRAYTPRVVVNSISHISIVLGECLCPWGLDFWERYA